MNAQELADYFEYELKDVFPYCILTIRMLREQAEQIAELEKDLEGCEYFLNKTKPLSDEEIEDLVDKCTDTTDDNDGLEFRYNDFVRAIEEKHGIK